MYRNILVPLDGSDTSRRGLQEALSLAKALRSRITVLHVTSDFPVMLEMSGTIDFDQYQQGLHEYGRRLLEEVQAEVAKGAVAVSTLLREVKSGRVADVIVHEARDSDCDLI